MICSDHGRRKLLDPVSDVARFRHLSLRTEEAYRNWIKRFIFFHAKRHPRDLDTAAIRSFLTHLAVNEHISQRVELLLANSFRVRRLPDDC